MKTLLTLMALNSGIANADQTLFAGTILSENTADTIVDYRNTNGAQVTAESIDNYPEFASASEIGVRSPKFKGFRANGTFTIENQAYNAFAERFIGDHLVRAGVLGDGTNLVGGFVGGKVDTENFGLDLDVGYHSVLDARGFVSAEPGKVYLSLGGNTYEKTLVTFLGTTNVGKPGVLFYGNADLDDETFAGKLFLGDRFTVTKKALDFKQHIKIGTQMERVTSGGVLDSWPPFDAYVSERFSAVGSAIYAEDELTLGLKGFYAQKKNFVFGIGADTTKTATFELFSKLPGTPLEAWVEGSIHTDTGEMGARAYLGGSWSW